MTTATESGDAETWRRERDLYLRLLDLGEQDELEPFLDESLRLLTELTGAHQGYIEICPESGIGPEDAPRWWAAQGYSEDEIAAVRKTISRGIIAEALATGRTIVTHSALLDDRFSERESVRLGHIEAVLCAPIGANSPVGVVYLQRRQRPGPFPKADRDRLERFARHLRPYAERLVERRRQRESTDLVGPLRALLKLDPIVGRSAALAAALRDVAVVAPLEVSVLLLGESGVGKSQLARVIHDNSPRAGRPFVELNCATIPENLVESELFGALPGSHSTATSRMTGKVEAAAGGTLFLDEIAELSLPAQAKLLQFLQSQEYYPLGAARALRADTRIIAATNVDLEAAARARRFREDLFYRLQVLPIRIPSLAERREDVPELAQAFLADSVRRHRLPHLVLSPEALGAIEVAEWSGNVRQLAHAIEAAAIRAAGENSRAVERRHVFPERPRADGEGGDLVPTYQEATRRFQAQLVRRTLEATSWNVSEAARRLDVTRSYLYELIRAYGLERKTA